MFSPSSLLEMSLFWSTTGSFIIFLVNYFLKRQTNHLSENLLFCLVFFICYMYRILRNKAPYLLRTLADRHLCLVIRKEIGLIRSLFCKYFEQSSTAFESEIIGEISSLLLCSYMICSCLHWYGVLNPFLLVSVSSIIGEIKKWWSTNSNNGFKNKIL